MVQKLQKTWLLLCMLLLTGVAFAQQARIQDANASSNSDAARLGCSMNITCPPNVVHYADSGLCSAIISYTDPVTTNGCGTSGSQTFLYTGAIQTFTVPAGVTQIYMTARGAQGGSVTTTCAATGGKGALVQGLVPVTAGEVLSILVGQQGFTNGQDAGGGGGTFIVRTGNIPLMVAGGGGGATNNINNCGTNRNGIDASITTSGTASANNVVSGGINGNGGGASNGSGGGGGGFLTNGTPGSGTAASAGKSYLNGGAGGTGNDNDNGGYGGGGAGWFTGGNGGGGGGYSGGGTSGNQPFTGGGGGGSYCIASGISFTVSTLTGDGRVDFSWTAPGNAFTVLTQGIPNGGSFPVGITTQHYLGTDSLPAASDDSCTFTVTVLDTVDPTIVCPNNMIVSNDPGTCAAVVSYAAPLTTDACLGVTTTQTAGLPSGAAYPQGITINSFEAEDASANLSTCSFTVEVIVDDSSTQTFLVCDGETVTVGNSVYNTSGTYYDTFQNGGGCDSVVVTVLTVKPPINTTTSANGLTITAQLAGAAYQWIDCDNGNAAIQGENSQSFTSTSGGNYAVIVTVGSCVDTSACEVVVGVNSPRSSNFTLYPNPTSGKVNIVFGSMLETATIEVYDIAGKRLLERHESNVAVSVLDFSSLGNGVYFVKVISAAGQDMLRVVKQN